MISNNASEHYKDGWQAGYVAGREEAIAEAAPAQAVTKPFCYMRFRHGEPDWSEDCVTCAEDGHTDQRDCYEAEDGFTHEPLYLHPPTAKGDTGAAGELRKVAVDLLAAVDSNHSAKNPPMKYTVPWTEIVALREALEKNKSDAAPLPQAGWLPIELSASEQRALRVCEDDIASLDNSDLDDVAEVCAALRRLSAPPQAQDKK